MNTKENYPLKKFTTLAIGGPAEYFVTVKNENDLAAAMEFARGHGLPWYVVGEGSNLVVSDKGFKGVIIRSAIEKFKRRGNIVAVGAGSNLLNLILKVDKMGLSGMERMAGIPGTVGGAIYGCAGAYGQEIKDHLVWVKVFDGKKIKTLSRAECRFSYRSSVFKIRKSWVITEAAFKLGKGRRAELLKISRDTIKLRAKKYKPGLKCPGSFFKNLLASDVKVTAAIKPAVVYGKIPAGYLLEQVGAKGMGLGTIRVAQHHANLIYNPGRGTAADVKKLADKLKALVKKKFGIIIEEEVQYL